MRTPKPSEIANFKKEANDFFKGLVSVNDVKFISFYFENSCWLLTSFPKIFFNLKRDTSCNFPTSSLSKSALFKYNLSQVSEKRNK